MDDDDRKEGISVKKIRKEELGYLEQTAEEFYECLREMGVPDHDIDVARSIIGDRDFDKRLSEDPVSVSVQFSSLARRNGIDDVQMNKLCEDFLIETERMDPNDSFDLYVDLTDVDDDVKDVLQRAKEGDPDAQYEMGMRYRTGDGVFEDEQESVRWLGSAADGGNVDAMYEMGVSFDLGIGLPIDEFAAEEWYRKAAEHGHEKAKKIIEEMDS